MITTNYQKHEIKLLLWKCTLIGKIAVSKTVVYVMSVMGVRVPSLP